MFFFNRSLLYIAALFLCCGITSLAQKSVTKGSQTGQVLVNNRWKHTPAGRFDSQGIPRTLYHLNVGPLSGNSEQMARTFLNQYQSSLHLKESLSDIHTTMQQGSHGVQHVRFEQRFQGIPVYHGDIVVSINRENYVTFVSSNYKSNISLPSLQASVTPDAVLQIAVDHLQFKSGIQNKQQTGLIIYADEGPARLAYQVKFSSSDPGGSWEVLVDAQTGDVIRVRDLRMYHHGEEAQKLSEHKTAVNGTGYVFDPDPLTTAQVNYNTSGFTDGDNGDTPQLNNQRFLVTLNDIFSSGSTYSLSGPYVSITDWDLPNIGPVIVTHPDSFRFLRSQSGFEDVNVYYHIDKSQRRIQSLGFTTIQNAPIPADPHGANGADNSYFDTFENAVSFGDGSVDDGEDADVIWHEYGHAIQWGTVPGFGDNTNGNEEGAIGEGFGDYWAGSYSRSVNPNFSKNFVFTWDAGFNGTTGTLWSGRPLNLPASYPSTGVSGMNVHDGGEYWSSVLMLIWDDIGRDIMDQLVLKSHFYLGTFATMPDNAEAILQADQDLFGGAHLTQIATRFAQRNFLPPPQASHIPVRDTENISGPFTVTVTVVPGYFSLASNGVKILWSRDSLFADSVILNPTGNPNEYSGTIPGNGTAAQYKYYFSIEDQVGTMTRYPANAPSSFFSFYAGTDTVKPLLTFTPPFNPAKLLWPPTLSAKAKDNVGIDSVWIEFTRQRGNLTGTFPLTAINDSIYIGIFELDSSQVIVGDSIFYNVKTKDAATIGNITISPSSGLHKFMVSKIKILIGSQASTSSVLLYRTLTVMDAIVDSLRWSGLIADSLIPKYDLLIVTAGTNPIPNISKRAEIVSRVENNGRVWIEGGEIGSRFKKPDAGGEIDLNFRRVVLHDSSWINDASTSSLILAPSSHRLFTTPNSVASPIAFTTTTATADRDAMTLIPNDPGVISLAGWSSIPSSAGIISYTPQNSLTPLTLFFPFALSSMTDTSVAGKLIENSLFYFFPQLGPTAVQDDNHTIPSAFSLEQNYPNPFNPQTTIRIQVPAASSVSLKVYNVLGQHVVTLFDGRKEAGRYDMMFTADGFASGVYFCTMSATNVSSKEFFTETKKMLFVR